MGDQTAEAEKPTLQTWKPRRVEIAPGAAVDAMGICAAHNLFWTACKTKA
jgi:hypothetical protein